MNSCKSSSRSWSSTSRSLNTALKCALACVWFATAGASAARGLAPPGLYAIEVTREGASDDGVPLKVEACLSSKVIESGEAFLSRIDDALKACPIADVRFNNEELLYRVACEQGASPAANPDQLPARAKFVQTRTGYEGVITIPVDGTRKKIIERHRAQRIGECAEAASPHVMFLDAQQWRERRHLRGNW